MKGAKLIYIGTVAALFLFIIVVTQENIIIKGGVTFLFYFVMIFIMKGVTRSLMHLLGKSEQVFEVLDFNGPKEVFYHQVDI